MGFSKRMGFQALSKDIQIESVDDELRNGLWNLLKIYLIDSLSRNKTYGSKFSDFENLCIYIWHHYYKLTIDTIPYDNRQKENYIREIFFKYKWYEVYDFLEFLLDLNFQNFENQDFKASINELLIREFSGYRIIDNKFCPITNELEIEEIRETFSHYTGFEGSNIHLSNSLAKLSDKKNPDYANSIKESISALGSVIRSITGESTFGKGIAKLAANGIEIDEQIKASIEKLYAYTNNKEGGIRHEIVDEYKSPDFDDAKLMLVICSAFINLIISKSKK